MPLVVGDRVERIDINGGSREAVPVGTIGTVVKIEDTDYYPDGHLVLVQWDTGYAVKFFSSRMRKVEMATKEEDKPIAKDDIVVCVKKASGWYSSTAVGEQYTCNGVSEDGRYIKILGSWCKIDRFKKVKPYVTPEGAKEISKHLAHLFTGYYLDDGRPLYIRPDYTRYLNKGYSRDYLMRTGIVAAEGQRMRTITHRYADKDKYSFLEGHPYIENGKWVVDYSYYYAIDYYTNQTTIVRKKVTATYDRDHGMWLTLDPEGGRFHFDYVQVTVPGLVYTQEFGWVKEKDLPPRPPRLR